MLHRGTDQDPYRPLLRWFDFHVRKVSAVLHVLRMLIVSKLWGTSEVIPNLLALSKTLKAAAGALGYTAESWNAELHVSHASQHASVDAPQMSAGAGTNVPSACRVLR